MGIVAKILIGIAIVLVVLVAGVAIVALTVDPNTLIAPVQARIKAATGRDLTVGGGARIALSLQPRVVLRDVVLGGAPGAPGGDLLKAERVELAVALLPLLSRRFEVREIALVKPEIALATDGKGRKNWELPSSSAAPATGGSDTLAAAVAIGDIEVSDGTVTYRDGPNAPVSKVTIEKLSLKPRALSSTVAVEFRGVAADVPVALEGTVGSLESLLARRWPYPIDLAGTIAGQKTALAAKVKAEGPRYTLDDLKLTLGTNALTGTFAVETGSARPKLLFDLAAPALALNALPVPATVPASSPAKAARGYVFPDTPVSFAPLRWVDAQGKLAIGKLTLADGRQYDNLRMSAALDTGRLQVPDLSASLLGGALAGSIVVDAAQADATALTLRLEGKGMSLGAILTAAGHPREVSGGKTDVSVNLAMRGNSPHAWASTATGNVLLVSGPATLVNSKLANLTSVWTSSRRGQSLSHARPVDGARVRGRAPSARQRHCQGRPLARRGVAKGRGVGVGHARLPQRDARLHVPAQGAQGRVHRFRRVQRSRSHQRAVHLASPRGGRRGIGQGHRKHRRGGGHRRTVRRRSGAVHVGGRQGARPLSDCARRRGSAQRKPPRLAVRRRSRSRATSARRWENCSASRAG